MAVVQFNYINYQPFISLKRTLSENYNFLPKVLGYSKFQYLIPPLSVQHFKQTNNHISPATFNSNHLMYKILIMPPVIKTQKKAAYQSVTS